MRVTVEKKETGETGLKLESLADEMPVKPKKEEPKKEPGPRRSPRKAAARKPVLQKAKPAPRDGGVKRSLVPQLPRKS